MLKGKFITDPDCIQNLGIRKKGTNLFNFLTEFQNSDALGVEIDPVECGYKNGYIARGCLCTSIKRYGFCMRVVKRGDKVYIIKEA